MKKYVIGGLVLLVLILSVSCGGWNEGSGSGSCTIAFLEPVYNFSMNLLLVLAFTAIVWIPGILIARFALRAFKKRHEKEAPVVIVEPKNASHDTTASLAKTLLWGVLCVMGIFLITTWVLQIFL